MNATKFEFMLLLFPYQLRKRVLLFLFFALFLTKLNASTGIASTGIWSQASTWSFNGVNRVPNCGDTLIIPTSVIVTVNAMENYTSCSSVMTIIIDGTLQLTNGNKLKLPCGSTVTLLANGVIRKSTPGGGMSTIIEICGCSAWYAGLGNVTGPGNIACTILPVTMLYFNVRDNDKEVSLTWGTSTEINNSSFNIERSVDGKTFYTIGKVNGHGTSNINHDYIFTDKTPLHGISYYRLKQIDFDNNFSFSEIIVTQFNHNRSLNVLQSIDNSDNKSKLIISNSLSPVVAITIYDLLGKNILSQRIDSQNGNCVFIIPQEISSGIYLVNVSDGESIASTKVVLGH